MFAHVLVLRAAHPAACAIMMGTVCPTSPCPYCVLQLRHTLTWQQVQERWGQFESQTEEGRQNTFKFQMQRMAFEWLAEHFHTGHGLAGLERPAAGAATAANTSSARLTPGRNKIPSSRQTASSSSASALPTRPLLLQPPPPSTSEALVPWTTASRDSSSGLPDVAEEQDWPRFFWDRSSQTAKKRKWARYDPMQEQAIRQAYLAGDSSVNIAVEIEGQGHVFVYHYTVDLTPGAMIQTSEDTGYVRRVSVREFSTEHGV